MLSFLTFKDKEFISLISLYSEKSKTRRHFSRIQTVMSKGNNYTVYNLHGKIHREQKELNCVLPAVIVSNGRQEWYKNDKCHRDEKDENGRVLPAIIYNNGSQYWQYWYRNGKTHRDERDENGRVLPAVISNNGFQEWYVNGINETSLFVFL